MLIYRGAAVYAEDTHDERSPYSPVELECLKHGHEPPTSVHEDVTVSPIFRHGRWLVPCPWCFSVSKASRTDHRFFCVECRNVGAGGMWIRVVWPESRDEIVALLVMRPDPRTRNWAPPETLGDLVVENERYGVL